MVRALLISTASHALVLTAVAGELNIPMFELRQPDPIEVEILFEEEAIEVSETVVLEDFSRPVPPDENDADDIPVDETDVPQADPEVQPPRVETDPAFRPASTDDATLPEGLDPAIERDDVLDPTAAPEPPADDQSPDEDDFAAAENDSVGDLISRLADEASAETGDGAEDEVFVPAYPKPRPRAAPVYSDPDEEARVAAEAAANAAEAEEAAQAAEAATTEQAARDQREQQARLQAAETRASEYTINCVHGQWRWPVGVNDLRAWQVSFILSLDADGMIEEIARGDVAAEDGAEQDLINAFVLSAESALFGCEPFLDPSGASDKPFIIEPVLRPRNSQ